MTPLREKRLLILAQSPNADHKRWYSQYCILMGHGLVGWQLGTAFLTSKGQRLLTSYMLDDLAKIDSNYI